MISVLCSHFAPDTKSQRNKGEKITVHCQRECMKSEEVKPLWLIYLGTQKGLFPLLSKEVVRIGPFGIQHSLLLGAFSPYFTTCQAQRVLNNTCECLLQQYDTVVICVGSRAKLSATY